MTPRLFAASLASCFALCACTANAPRADPPAIEAAPSGPREVTLDVSKAERVIRLPEPPRLDPGRFVRLVDDPMLAGTPGLWQVMEGPFLAGGGDLNGDRVPDLLVSNRNVNRDVPARPNTLRGYSGDDGRLLFEIVGGKGFGRAFAFADDIDHDGCSDVHVVVSDAVSAYSGRTGALLYTVEDVVPSHDFGSALIRIADRDGDRCDDLAWAAADYSLQLSSGANGKSLGSVPIGFEPGQTGAMQLAALGDVDADGTPDWGALTDASLSLGSLHVFSGRTGAELLRVHQAGAVLAAVGDVDGDGHADILLGTDDRDGVPLERDGVIVLSGRTALPLDFFQWTAPDNGDSNECNVCGLGDTNGDGVADFAIARPRWSQSICNLTPACVYVISGRDGSLLRTLLGSFEDETHAGPGTSQAFGISMAALGDVNGDGLADFAASEDRYPNHVDDPDRAVVFLGEHAGPGR